MIAAELTTIIAGTGKMPSVSELREIGRNDLAIQVSRKGGFLSWATRLGATRAVSDSDTGWTGEIDLLEKLNERGFIAARMDAVKSPYDIKVNGVLRIDVKSANYTEYGVCRGWFYRIGKEPQADVIALYQIDTGVCYFLPHTGCPTSNVTISRSGGKYAAFKDRYDILEKIIQSRTAELAEWPTRSE